MFDFSWAEIIVVALVGLLLIGPDELPSVIRSCKNVIKKVKEIGSDFTSSILESDEIRTIIDLEGNEQETYDMSDIMGEIEKAKPKPKNPDE